MTVKETNLYKCPLENKKDWVKHKEWWVLYVDTQTLINDIKCDVCDTLECCGYINHLEKLKARRRAEREKLILKKRLWQIK